MRILGLGKPDTVPKLTDAKAIELGGELLAEFIVFGTAISIVLIEYYRSSVKAANKTDSDDQKILKLETQQAELIGKLAKTSTLLEKLENSIKEQNKKTTDLNSKYDKLNEKFNVKTSSKGAQTSEGRQIGKIIIPTKLAKTANMDVRNSIVYQCAEEAVNELRFYGVKESLV